MTVPYQYQIDSVDRMNAFNGRALLGHEMGLGKSFISLLWAMENKSARPIVIVCPAILKENWRRQCEQHLGWRAEILNGLRPPRVTLPWDRNGIYIVNYDIVAPRRGKRGGDGWLKILQKLKPGLLILDECHYLIDPRSHRTKACKTLAKQIENLFALSGTPLTNRPLELFPVLNMLRPNIFHSLTKFANTYSNRVMTPWGPQWEGVRNLRSLHRKLTRHCMIRYRTQDVLKDLPRYARHVVPLPLSPEARSQYDMAEKTFLEWIAKYKPKKLLGAMRAEALVKSGYVLRLAAELKLPAVKEWIANYFQETDSKLIVFGHQIKLVEELHSAWPKSSVLVYGGTKKQDRMKCIDQFNNGDRTRLFVGNLAAAGHGWDAKACSTTAFYEFGWAPGKLSQAEKRTHGIGRGQQGKRSKAYYLVAEDTLEEKVLKLLQQKQEHIDQVLDGKVTEDGIDVFDLFIQELSKRRRS